jgi:hypothetical protein
MGVAQQRITFAADLVIYKRGKTTTFQRLSVSTRKPTNTPTR